MKNFKKNLFIVGIVSLLVTVTGCQENEINGTSAMDSNHSNPSATAKTPGLETSDNNAEVNKDKPVLKFENRVYDFGIKPVKSSVKCEFRFKNEGNETLIFSRHPKTDCGCTVAKLDKMKYAPGESGTLNVRYRGESSPMKVNKGITVFSNDPANPRIELAIKGEIQTQVSAEPENIGLELDKKNAGIQPITLKAKDGKPFSITGFASTGTAITADFDKSKKSVKHVIDPEVDIEKLKKVLKGNITVNIDHPSTKQLLLHYTTLPPYKLSSNRIFLLDPEPGKPQKREIMIMSNYGKKVEIESVESARNYMKIVDKEPKGKALKIVVEVTPRTEKGASGFYDNMTINFKTGEKATIISSGFYGTSK